MRPVQLPVATRAARLTANLAAPHPRRYFYTHYGFAEGDQSAAAIPVEATPEWRASLSFGSWVDAVKIDPMDRSRCWMHALIGEETDTQFKLEFEQLSDYYSRWVPKDSVDLAPMDSKKKTEAVDEDWFMSLKPGDRLDCLDPYDKWYDQHSAGPRVLAKHAPLCAVPDHQG